MYCLSAFCTFVCVVLIVIIRHHLLPSSSTKRYCLFMSPVCTVVFFSIYPAPPSFYQEVLILCHLFVRRFSSSTTFYQEVLIVSFVLIVCVTLLCGVFLRHQLLPRGIDYLCHLFVRCFFIRHHLLSTKRYCFWRFCTFFLYYPAPTFFLPRGINCLWPFCTMFFIRHHLLPRGIVYDLSVRFFLSGTTFYQEVLFVTFM